MCNAIDHFNEKHLRIKWFVYGLSDVMREQGEDSVHVVYPGIPDSHEEMFENCSLFIVPDSHEDHCNIIALSAMLLGIPTLVPRDSSIGNLLVSFCHPCVANSIVTVPADSNLTREIWARRIGEVFEEPEKVLKSAEDICKTLRELETIRELPILYEEEDGINSESVGAAELMSLQSQPEHHNPNDSNTVSEISDREEPENLNVNPPSSLSGDNMPSTLITQAELSDEYGKAQVPLQLLWDHLSSEHNSSQHQDVVTSESQHQDVSVSENENETDIFNTISTPAIDISYEEFSLLVTSVAEHQPPTMWTGRQNFNARNDGERIIFFILKFVFISFICLRVINELRHSSFSIIRHDMPNAGRIQWFAAIECQCCQDSASIWQKMTNCEKTQLFFTRK